jgi:hypothetical protein|tara:strand:- start:357 stop:632 length:276 start_codon:yes stop_codon:yes gene_type:complete
MQENNSTQHDSIKSEDALTASDIEYARRNGLSSSDMLAFKEDIMIEEEKEAELIRLESQWQADQWQKQQRLQWENFREQQEQIEQEHLNDN